MTTSAPNTPQERQQALLRLQAAFGQPDGSLVFTYQGQVYYSTGTNADGTINARSGHGTSDLTTTTLDPVAVYEAIRIAEGMGPIPIIPPKPSTPAQPSMLAKTVAGLGMVSGLISLAKMAKPVENLLKGKKLALANPIIGGVTTFLSAVSLFQSGQSIYKNGVSKSGLMNLGMSLFGMISGVHSILPATVANAWLASAVAAAAVISASLVYSGVNDWINNGFSTKALATTLVSATALDVSTNILAYMIGLAVPGIGPMVTAAVIALSALWSYLHKPAPEEVALKDLTAQLTPAVWSAGPVIFVAAGTAALLMGRPLTSDINIMSTITMPQSYATRAMGRAIPMGTDPKSPTVLVEHGNGTSPGFVTIVTPQGIDAQRNTILGMESYELTKDFEFVSSNPKPQDGYIPFFICVDGKTVTNPEVVKALSRQNSLLNATLSGGLDVQEALSSIQLAAVSNKYG